MWPLILLLRHGRNSAQAFCNEPKLNSSADHSRDKHHAPDGVSRCSTASLITSDLTGNWLLTQNVGRLNINHLPVSSCLARSC